MALYPMAPSKPLQLGGLGLAVGNGGAVAGFRRFSCWKNIFQFLAFIRAIVGEAAGIALSLEQAADSPSLQPLGGEAQSLLLIDDCRETALELKALIEESFPCTFALEWATSLGEAMAILEQKNVSIVISEIEVSNEDMTPFLKTLKHFKPHVVTIVLTAFKAASLLVGLINQGQVHRFLPKPMRTVMTGRGIQSGINHSREIQSRPDIVRRHKVDAPIKEPEPGLISRIRGLFTRAEKPLHTPLVIVVASRFQALPAS